MMKKILLLIISLLLLSCDLLVQYRPYYLDYEANFSSSKIPLVETEIRRISEEWGLALSEHPKVSPEFTWGGAEMFAMFIGVYDPSDWFFVVDNLGEKENDIISVTFYENDSIPTNILDRLASEVICTLQEKVGLEFYRTGEDEVRIEPLMPRPSLECENQ